VTQKEEKMNPLCIYHGNCADGFGAAWVVRRYFNIFGDGADFHPGVYGFDPPDVRGRDVVMVDFSYKRPVLDKLITGPGCAKSMLILDHHKSAAEDLAGIRAPFGMGWKRHMDNVAQDTCEGIDGTPYALFDMERSGAGLAWDFFFSSEPRPKLIDTIEDRDLWRFKLPLTREIQATVFSYAYDFDLWDKLMDEGQSERGRATMAAEGRAIDRKMLKDIAELLGVATREMRIGGVVVPVVNLPYTMASEAAGKLAENAPFAAAYFDRADARVFSLRSRGDSGADVSAIAKAYGGGGHRNAAGFQVPLGWEGDKP
jgi:hypothetical protein